MSTLPASIEPSRPAPRMPVRNASRNGSGLHPGPTPPLRVCHRCGNAYEGTSRPSSYCSAGCRQAAFRARRQQPVVGPLPRRSHQLDVLYECTCCGERLLNEQRCDSAECGELATDTTWT